MHNNFGDLFWRPVLLYPDKLVIEQGDHSLTYAQLEDRTQRVARMLADLGVRKGDKVLLMMTNDYRYAESLFGVLRAGAIAVPANIKLGNDALSYIADHSDAVVLFGTGDLAAKIAAVC